MSAGSVDTPSGGTSTPEITVETLAKRLHLQVPGRPDEQKNRKAGLGPLVGLAAGVGTGATLELAAAIGPRPGRAVGTGMAFLAVMLAGNAPMTLLGITDPRTWSRADWAADLIPHLAYAVVTAHVLDGLQRSEGSTTR